MHSRILLIAPEFFSYHKMIVEELLNQGWSVDFLPDRPSNSTLVKILIRKFKFFVTPYLNKFFLKRLIELTKDNSKYNYVLIIKGEGLTPTILKKIRSNYTKGPIVLYYWDSLKNVPGGLGNTFYVDQVLTFDPADASKYGFKLLPLFHHKTFSIVEKNIWKGCFIGSVHSDRIKVITNLIQNTKKFGESYIYIYFPSRIQLIFRNIFDPAFTKLNKNQYGLYPLDTDKVKETILKSEIVFDIHHQSQSGLTMRTIEALAMGKKLITTNSTIKKYEFYDPLQILIVNRKNPIVPLEFINSPGVKDFNIRMLPYSLEFWLKKLLSFKFEGK